MRRLLYIVIMSLLGASLVHVSLLLCWPYFFCPSPLPLWKEQKACLRVPNSTSVALLKNADPAFSYAVFSFDLSKGPIMILEKQPVVFWSFSVYDKQGHSLYALNQDNSLNQNLQFFIALPLQARSLQAALPEESVRITSNTSQGLIVLRSYAGTPSAKALSETFVSNLICESFKK